MDSVREVTEGEWKAGNDCASFRKSWARPRVRSSLRSVSHPGQHVSTLDAGAVM